MEVKLRSTDILGVGITTESAKSILQYVIQHIEKKGTKLFIITPNPEILAYASEHPSFKTILNSAQIALPDGVGISIGAWLLGRGRVSRITGIDMLEKLALMASKNAYSIGLFGGIGGVAEKAAECLRLKYPGVKIEYALSEENLKQMKAQKVDILFVALGHPKQELWISKYLDILPVKVAMGVGGSFDYLAGNVSRAPYFLRTIGLEWLFRLIIQPWRWKRQLALFEYMSLILQEKRKA